MSRPATADVTTVAPHHRPTGGFCNPWPSGRRAGSGGLVRWILWERLVGRGPQDPNPAVFERRSPTYDAPRAAPDRLTATWVGHATLLIQMGGLNILTDPVWSARASPVQFAGPKRWVAPGVDFRALPPIDVVLLSHNHYDHLDQYTVRQLAARVPGAHWLVPLGLAAFIRARGVRLAEEVDWWGESRLRGARFTAVPAQHFSARGLRDGDATLWCGWAIEVKGRRFLFAGDTGLHPEFGLIGERCGPFDVVALPVGAYQPRWFMRAVHMDPDDALTAFRDLHARRGDTRRTAFLPIHWGTFKLTDEPMDEPPRRTAAAWAAAGLPSENLWLLAHGETRAL